MVHSPLLHLRQPVATTSEIATLESAIYAHDLDRVKEILNFDPRPSQRELDKALMLATSHEEGGDVNAVMPLLFYGARITEPAFLAAVRYPDNTIFQIFLDFGWDINSLDFGEPALR
jgi:hypothetical protein